MKKIGYDIIALIVIAVLISAMIIFMVKSTQDRDRMLLEAFADMRSDNTKILEAVAAIEHRTTIVGKDVPVAQMQPPLVWQMPMIQLPVATPPAAKAELAPSVKADAPVSTRKSSGSREATSAGKPFAGDDNSRGQSPASHIYPTLPAVISNRGLVRS